MATVNKSLFDEEVKRAIRIEQFKNGAVQRAISTLRESDSKYADRLASQIRKLDPGGFNVNARLQKRIESAVKAADDVRDAAFVRMSEQISAELGEFGVDEVSAQKFILNSYTGSQIAVPTTAQLNSATFSRPFQGRLLKDWYRDLREADKTRIRNTVATGFREGLTTDQIVDSIIGTRSQAFKNGIVNTTNNQVQTIVRTAINHFANSARQSVFEKNQDIISGLRWTSTLDGRTSLICAGRDGEVWEVDKGPRPPAHYSCRSIMVAVINNVSLSGTRPAITDTRTRKQRERDFRMQAQESVGSRWSSMTAKQRNQEVGKIRSTWQKENIGTVTAKTTFESWLRRQSAEFQDEYLGPKRGALFRRGKISIDRFVNKKGKTLTLDELRRANSKAWKKAGL